MGKTTAKDLTIAQLKKMLTEAQAKIDKLCFPNTKSGIPYNFSISGIKAIVKDFKNVCNDEN